MRVLSSQAVLFVWLLLISHTLASSVIGYEALFYYSVFLADFSINGKATSIAPGLALKWSGSGPPTLYDFLQNVVTRDKALAAGYQSSSTARMLLGTSTPDIDLAAKFLNDWPIPGTGSSKARYFFGAYNNEALFGGQWATTPHPYADYSKKAVDIMQTIRQKVQGTPNAASIDDLNNNAKSALTTALDGRQADNGPAALAALKKSGIPGLVVVPKPSPFDSTTQIPDMEATLQQSSLSPENETKLKTYLLTVPGNRPGKLAEVSSHAVIIAGVDTQLSRLDNPNPHC